VVEKVNLFILRKTIKVRIGRALITTINKRKKKENEMKFVKNIILLLTFSVVAFSSDARVEALGGNYGFWADDDQAWKSFPAAINNVDYINVSGAGNGNGSASIVWGEGTTWGFSFTGAPTSPSETGMGLDDEQNDWLNLMWGNGSMGVSFGLGMASSNTGVTGAEDESTMNMDVGFGMTMGFGEIGVSFSNGSYTDGDEANDEGSTVIGFNLRRAQPLWLFTDMLVEFATMTNTDGPDATDGGMNLDVNLYRHFDMSDGVNALFALGFGFASTTTDPGVTGVDATSGSVMSLPKATLAVEAGVTDWATVRFGMNHSYVLSGTNEDESTWSGSADGDGESNFGWNFGLGFDYGSFNLDMVLSDDGEELFNNPVHFVTGRNEDPLSGSATLTWKF